MKNDFKVTDLHALAAFNPRLVKMIPDIRAIRASLKLGFKLDGVEVTTDNEKDK